MCEVEEDFPNKEIGREVKKARIAKGYSTTHLGNIIGVSHVTILNVEKGKETSDVVMIALGRELESHFNVSWLQEHKKKYNSLEPDIYSLFESKIREIVRDELDANEVVYKEKPKQKALNTTSTFKNAQEIAPKSKEKMKMLKEENEEIKKVG